MARQHTNGEAYTNPEVRFERTDAEIGPIVKGAVYLFAFMSAAAVLAVWLAWHLTLWEGPAKETQLPPAKVDAVKGKEGTYSALPPEPRLEGLEDVREREKKNFVMYPPRAKEFYDRQERGLKAGDKGAGVESLDDAVKGVPALLPVRKTGQEKAPTNYGVELPSRASAGRTTTGGQ